MKKIAITTVSTYANIGHRMEQDLTYTLLGEIRAHDSVPFFVDSDIPELHMSVKASGFTLASARLNMGETFEEKLDDFFARVASTSFAYCTLENEAYIMNADEFRCFLCQFCGLDRESSKNGGGCKVRCRKESKKMREWLASRV